MQTILGLVFFFSLGLVGIAILIGAARTTRTLPSVLLFGIYGSIPMAINCLVLLWAAGIQAGTNGSSSEYGWFRLAAAVSIVSLTTYFVTAIRRLYKEGNLLRQGTTGRNDSSEDNSKTPPSGNVRPDPR